jgi:hypothetical protein
MNGDAKGDANAWAEHADKLATWAWRFVNRTDVWGGYRALHERGKRYVRADGTPATLGHVTTRPLPSVRGSVRLTRDVLVAHFRATAPEHVVGLHTTSPDNLSLWGAVEVDWHGEGGNSAQANLTAALAWYDELIRLGFRPLLTDSNGKGGYHLRVLFQEPVATPIIFTFLRWLTRDHASHGLTAAPETFPKQPRVEAGKFGNWLRLPGRHHSRDHWSQTWEGSRWLIGGDAANHLLTFTGDPPSLLPPELVVPVRRESAAPPSARPLVAPAALAAPVCSLTRRISAYMARLPRLGEGQGRDDVAYRFACWLVRDMALLDDVALEWLRRWDAGNAPPKGEGALRKVVASAHAYGRSAYGTGLRKESVGKLGGHSLRRLSFTVTVEA